MGAVEGRVGRLRNYVVDTVAKFVKESTYFVMTEQRRSGYGGFSEITDER